MRTALLFIGLAILDHGNTEKPSESEGNWISGLFMVAMVMDVIEFLCGLPL